MLVFYNNIVALIVCVNVTISIHLWVFMSPLIINDMLLFQGPVPCWNKFSLTGPHFGKRTLFLSVYIDFKCMQSHWHTENYLRGYIYTSWLHARTAFHFHIINYLECNSHSSFVEFQHQVHIWLSHSLDLQREIWHLYLVSTLESMRPFIVKVWNLKSDCCAHHTLSRVKLKTQRDGLTLQLCRASDFATAFPTGGTRHRKVRRSVKRRTFLVVIMFLVIPIVIMVTATVSTFCWYSIK